MGLLVKYLSDKPTLITKNEMIMKKTYTPPSMRILKTNTNYILASSLGRGIGTEGEAADSKEYRYRNYEF